MLLGSYERGPADQAVVLARPDARAFVSAPLPEMLRLLGRASVELDVATSGADTDFAVRLTDVDPSGKHLMIGHGIQRLKLRSGFSAPVAVAAGTRYRVTISMTSELAHTFVAGHRVGIIVSSSNFPLFDRNPNSGEDFFTSAATARSVVNTLYLDGAARLLVPRVP
jgi:putative CocE/NonD family hydrolase